MKKIAVLSVFLLILIPLFSFAQEYPTKSINMVVIVGPGSPQDISTRLLASKAEKLLGQPFLISNNGTGGGAIAMGILAREKPDGYHLISTGSSMLAVTPQIRPVAYKPEDFFPIMHYGSSRQVLAVRADSPWKTLKEFVDYAKKNPGKVNYGSLEVGTTINMAMQFIASQEGIQWTLVPYTGGGTATVALLGGHIMAESGVYSSIYPHVKTGSLRLLATYGERRIKSLPDLPTLRELGYDFVSEPLYMLAAPKGTPLPIVKKLDDAFRKAMDDPEFLQAMDKFGSNVSYRNSEELKRFIEEATARYGKMMKELHIPTEGGKK